MKKLLFILFATLTVSVVSAQQAENKQPEPKKAPNAEQMAKMQADRMKQQYLLGNDQYDKVYKLCLKKAQKQIARMEEMKKEQEQMDADMKKILNETQYERYQMQRNQPRMMRGGQQRGKMPQRGFCPMQIKGQFPPHMQGPFNPQMRGQFPAKGQFQPQMQGKAMPQMQMPAKELQKGEQIPPQIQGNKRRPAMYDDTRKADNAAQEAKSAETKELK
ncbi:MAG: hypothetical protein IKY80_00760 [Alistipes sp.]|nr:hypothetical protein [Alistipes sp.]